MPQSQTFSLEAFRSEDLLFQPHPQASFLKVRYLLPCSPYLADWGGCAQFLVRHPLSTCPPLAAPPAPLGTVSHSKAPCLGGQEVSGVGDGTPQS